MRVVLFSLLLSVVLFSCGNEPKKDVPVAAKTIPATPPAAAESALEKTGTEELMNMLAHYYSLKDALVAGSTQKADEAASKLMSAAEIFLAEHATPSAHPELRPGTQQIMQNAEAITRLNPENLDKRRELFSLISEDMFNVLKAAKLRHGGVYRDHCPMAFDEKGANWLSSDVAIKNPYLGEKMDDCGEVTDSL
ncbi:MAG: DUF3347 domain-containing protein [Chitinophagaceae bacterium]